MDQNGDRRGADLEPFRPYLRLIARMHLDYRLHSLIGPDDVVQDVFVKALEHWDQCRDPLHPKPWLRQILLRHMKDLVDAYLGPKRNLDRQVELEHSSVRIEAIIDGGESTPSERATRHEELDRLAAALAKLPADQQEVVIRKHLHQMKLREVAAALGISVGAAAGLYRRGLEALNRSLTFPE
jgi:RNA polymerase sigma-70 factor (ECF subfamily)